MKKKIKNYYFDDIIKFEDFDFDNYLKDEQLYENILIYNISHKTLFGAKPLRIIFDKIDGFIRVYDGNRYLVLLGGLDKIRYLIEIKSGITYIVSYNYAKIFDSYDSFSLEKTLTLHNVMILVKSVFNKDKNNYYYNMYLEKNSHQLPKKNNNK